VRGPLSASADPRERRCEGTTPANGFFDHAVEEGFIAAEQRRLLITDDDPARLVDRLAAA
jgi:predicted Rossmann-fold nucleotide-binding protein